MTPINYHRLAEREILQLASWYETRRRGLGRSFRLRLDHVLQAIAANPLRYAVEYANGVRLGQLKKFPCSVVYLDEEHWIWIVAVAHQKRRPQYWSHRLKNR